MSIFKETFPKFVRDQLEQREKIISSGANRSEDKFKFNSGNKSGRSEEFYTYTLNKQCVLRLSSAVDIMDEKIFQESAGVGASVAQKWVLEGGIKDNGKNRGGFTSGPQSRAKAGVAYGDINIRSDAADGYGIVPMPGITSATVRTKSAYGSLREAKVNFVCHNRRQLEVLEILYMRPGYTLMLEWGWNPYINNNGNTDNWSYLDNFFNNTKTTLELEKEILLKKEQTGGNYDALLGYCKNFTYSLRDDGGFNCTTEIIAKGEVITSLKDKTELIIDDSDDEVGSVYAKPALELLFQDMVNYSDDVEKIGNNGTAKERGKEIQKTLLDKLKLENIDQTSGTTTVGGEEIDEGTADENVLGEDALKPWIIADGPKGYQTKSYLTFWDDDEREQDGIYWNGRDRRTTTTWIRWDALTYLINQHVIPQDQQNNGIVEIQTNRIANEHTENPTIEPLLYVDKIPRFLAKSMPEIEGYTDLPGRIGKKRPLDWNLVDISVNNQMCMLPHNLYSHILRLPSAVEKDTLFQPLAKSLAKHVIKGRSVDTTRLLSITEQRQHIGGIYLGVEWMLFTFKNMYYDDDGNESKDYSLFKFLKKIWEGVNKSTGGNHEFDFHTDNRPDGKIIRIIDMNAVSDGLDLENIHTLKIQSLDSTVRDITYNTTIPSSLSSTIAIASQAPDSINTLDQVTFAAINKGIRDRFSTDVSVKSDYELIFGDIGETEQRTLWSNEYDKNLLAIFEALYIFDHDSWTEILGETAERYSWWEASLSGIPGVGATIAASKVTKNLNRNFGGVLRDLLYYQYTLNDNQYLREEAQPSMQSEDSAKFNGSIKALNKAISYFQKVYGKNDPNGNYYRGQPYNGATQRLSAIIPLKFNAKMDGISGLVIGNVFKLPKNRLPLAYNGDDVHFIAMGESQEISAGQDWTTSLTGQITLLGDPASKKGSKHQEWKESWKDIDVKIGSEINVRSYSPRAEEYPYSNQFAKYITDTDINNLCDPLTSMDITSEFGPRVINGVPGDHNGIDLRTKFKNTTEGDTTLAKVAFAVWDAKVIRVANTGKTCGGQIMLQFDGISYKNSKNNNGKSNPLKNEDVPRYPVANEEGRNQATPKFAQYCHMSEINVKEGDIVFKGQPIGKTGGDISQTGRGNSTVQHLHFALLKQGGSVPKDNISPAPWLPDNNDSWWNNIWQGDWWFPNSSTGGSVKTIEQSIEDAGDPAGQLQIGKNNLYGVGTPKI